MIRFVIQFYIYIIIADAILSYFPQYRYKTWAKKIHQLSDFTCSPVRKIIPENALPFDVAGLIVILGLQLFMALW